MLRKSSRHISRSGSPSRTACLAIIAGFITTGVSADTLAQPRDNALERTAADYVRFREDVEAIEKTPFTNADVTREAHRRLAAHDSYGLSNGWVAYAALVAADTPAFAKAMQKEMKAKKRGRNGLAGKDAFLAKLAADPSYPRKMQGAEKAIAAVLSMTVQDGARIEALGEAFKTQAYAMQKTKWGKQRIGSGSTRLSDADNYRRGRSAPTMPSLNHNIDGGVVAPVLASATGDWSPSWGQGGAGGRASVHNADVIIDRILNLAARYSTGSVNKKIVSVYAKNDRSERCLSMAKLTLDQCIAATRSPYEEAFCLGEHGLKDISTCVGWVANAR